MLNLKRKEQKGPSYCQLATQLHCSHLCSARLTTYLQKCSVRYDVNQASRLDYGTPLL